MAGVVANRAVRSRFAKGDVTRPAVLTRKWQKHHRLWEQRSSSLAIHFSAPDFSAFSFSYKTDPSSDKRCGGVPFCDDTRCCSRCRGAHDLAGRADRQSARAVAEADSRGAGRVVRISDQLRAGMLADEPRVVARFGGHCLQAATFCIGGRTTGVWSPFLSSPRLAPAHRLGRTQRCGPLAQVEHVAGLVPRHGRWQMGGTICAAIRLGCLHGSEAVFRRTCE